MASNGGGGSRVGIPAGVWKTLQSIREITGKQHSDDDIYTVLKECSFDPNETAQKLLYLDTFHEVKNKRDRKIETPMLATQGREPRNGRGNYLLNRASSDSAGGRNVPSRRGNGAHRITERKPSPAPQKGKISALPPMKKAPAAFNDVSSKLPNGSSNGANHRQTSAGDACHDGKDGANPSPKADVAQTSFALTQSFSSVVRKDQEKSTSNYNQLSAKGTKGSVSAANFSASDPVLAPSHSQPPASAGTINHGTGSQQKVDETSDIQETNHAITDVEGVREKQTSGDLSTINENNVSSKPKTVVNHPPSELVQSNYSSSTPDNTLALTSSHDSRLAEVMTTEGQTSSVNANTKLAPQSDVTDGPHVTFPVNFQVAESLRTGLTFGSFGSFNGIEMKIVDGANDEGNTTPLEFSNGSDVTTEEPSLSQLVSSTTVEEDDRNNLESPPPVPEQVQQVDAIISTGADLKEDQPKHEVLFNQESLQTPIVHNVPGYGYRLMPSVSGNQLVQVGATDAQSGSSVAPPNSNSSQAIPNSITLPQHPVTLFRQPYPHGYYPYGPYLPPFFVPSLHQVINPNTLLQQPSAANIYLPPGASVPGVKIPLQQFKQGTNMGNVAHFGIPSGYGAYPNPPIGFNHVPAVTSANPAANEDLTGSQLKENNIFTPSEGPTVWMHAPGQDFPTLQVNPLYNLSLQGHQLAYNPAQLGHGGFSGVYQQAQTMAASPVNPMLQQQTQAITASSETGGPPPTAYHHHQQQQQQPQLGQINWNNNYRV